MSTKKFDLKQKSSETAVKYGAKLDNHMLGFEYLCLELLAHDTIFPEDLVMDESGNIFLLHIHLQA
jgi:hypothetical protein